MSMFKSSFPYEVEIEYRKGEKWKYPAQSKLHAKLIIKDARGSGLKGKAKIRKVI